MFKCPACGKRFKYLAHLSKHFKLKHNSIDICPACGQKFKHLSCHLAKLALADEKHALYYFLLVNDRGNKKLRKIAGDIAYKLLATD